MQTPYIALRLRLWCPSADTDTCLSADTDTIHSLKTKAMVSASDSELSLYPSLEVDSNDVAVTSEHSEIKRESIVNDRSTGKLESPQVGLYFLVM